MKLNVFFVAAALAYSSSLVVARPVGFNLNAREVTDVVDINARELGVDVDIREYATEDLQAREAEADFDVDAREFVGDLEARAEEEIDIVEREPVSRLNFATVACTHAFVCFSNRLLL